MSETKQKILDVAERLFGEQGYDAVSLRHIIAEAGVNLAAVHYHFGSKDDLLLEVVMRKVQPVNERRLALLDQAEAEAAPGPPPLERVLEAFLLPAVLMAGKSPEFVKLMGRLHAEGTATAIFLKHFEPLINRFRAAMRGALPDLPEEELAWRTHFMVGAMAHTLNGPPATRPVPNGASGDDPRLVAGYLIAFLSGGLRAPVTTPARIAALKEKQ
jgi:AcrR family transcriptional regulator